MDLFRKTMKPVEQVLKDAGVKKDEIDDVSSGILGGSRSLQIDCPRWWFHPNPQGPATPQGLLQRQGAFQGNQPR